MTSIFFFVGKKSHSRRSLLLWLVSSVVISRINSWFHEYPPYNIGRTVRMDSSRIRWPHPVASHISQYPQLASRRIITNTIPPQCVAAAASLPPSSAPLPHPPRNRKTNRLRADNQNYTPISEACVANRSVSWCTQRFSSCQGVKGWNERSIRTFSPCITPPEGQLVDVVAAAKRKI